MCCHRVRHAARACSASCQIPMEDLEIQDQIGGGGFSLVYKGLWKGTPVAIKKWFDPNMTDQLMQEFRCASLGRHMAGRLSVLWQK